MKKTTSKLALKQETVRTLTPPELRRIAGGLPPIIPLTEARSSYPMYCCHGAPTTGGD